MTASTPGAHVTRTSWLSESGGATDRRRRALMIAPMSTPLRSSSTGNAASPTTRSRWCCPCPRTVTASPTSTSSSCAVPAPSTISSSLPTALPSRIVGPLCPRTRWNASTFTSRRPTIAMPVSSTPRARTRRSSSSVSTSSSARSPSKPATMACQGNPKRAGRSTVSLRLAAKTTMPTTPTTPNTAPTAAERTGTAVAPRPGSSAMRTPMGRATGAVTGVAPRNRHGARGASVPSARAANVPARQADSAARLITPIATTRNPAPSTSGSNDSPRSGSASPRCPPA